MNWPKTKQSLLEVQIRVLQDRIDYIREDYKQLSDTNFYRELENDPTEDYRREIQHVIKYMYQSGELDESVKKYLTDKSCKASRFYPLPNIHKGILPPPGRPVVASNGSLIEKISHSWENRRREGVSQIKEYS